MSDPRRPTDSRAARAWVAAFQRGFQRQPSVIEVTPDELLGLLQTADLRILTDPADVKSRKDS